MAGMKNGLKNKFGVVKEISYFSVFKSETKK
jgi:hypothetical protein